MPAPRSARPTPRSAARGRRALPALGLAVAGLLAGALPAAEAARPACPTGETLARRGATRVVQPRATIAAPVVCRDGRRRATLTRWAGSGSDADAPIAIRGRYVAYAAYFPPAAGGLDRPTGAVAVVDAVRGRRVSVTAASDAASDALPSRIVLAPTGRAAWTATADGACEVHALSTDGGGVVLAASRAIDPFSLALRGGTVSWSDTATGLRSAEL